MADSTKGKGDTGDTDEGPSRADQIETAETQLTTYVSIVLRGRVKGKIDEVMNRTYCNLIKEIFANESENGVQKHLEEKVQSILERVQFVGDDLETSISLLNPKYTRKRVRRKCKNTVVNIPGVRHLLKATSSAANFTRKNFDKAREWNNDRIERKMEEQKQSRLNRSKKYRHEKFNAHGAPVLGSEINYKQAASLKQAQEKQKNIKDKKLQAKSEYEKTTRNRQTSLENKVNTTKGGNPANLVMNEFVKGKSSFMDQIAKGKNAVMNIPGAQMAKNAASSYYDQVTGKPITPQESKGMSFGIDETVNTMKERFDEDIAELIEVFTKKFDDTDTRIMIKDTVKSPRVVEYINKALNTYLMDLLDPVTMRNLLLTELEKAAKTIIIKESTENGKINTVKRKIFENVLMKKQLLKNCQRIGMRKQYNEENTKGE